MNDKRLPPLYPEKLTIALFGKPVQLKNSIAKVILESDRDFAETLNFAVGRNNTFKIVNTPNIFEEEYPHLDQVIIDFMALTYPGPNLFILAIDQENIQEEKVVDQIRKLQDIFGETANLVVMLPDIVSYHALSHLKYRFRLAVASENLASECQKWCSASQAFLYDVNNYNQAVGMRRMAAFEKRRHDAHQPRQYWKEGNETRSLSTTKPAPGRAAAPKHHVGNSACDTWDNIFNIILVGLSGSGKSASANTILSAVKSNLQPRDMFESESSSMPVTTECRSIVTEEFGSPVRVVDTPDFLNDHIRNSQEQIEECKKYCQPGRYVVLLVMQLGRLTEGETEILEKLENKLGWNIRDSTIVLLTHGEDLKGRDLQQFIKQDSRLQRIVSLCGYRYHLFKNTSKSPKQVTELIEKIQNSQHLFPKFEKNEKNCCLS